MVMFTDPQTLFVNRYDEPFRTEVMEALTAAFPDVAIIELPSAPDEGAWDGRFSSACGIYVNSVVTNNAVYVPQFDSPLDAEVLALIDEHTSKAVVPVPSQDVCFMQGFGIDVNDPNVIGDEDDSRIVGHDITGGAEEGGRTAMENLLQRDPSINVVYTINEPAAAGAYEALNSFGLADQVLIVSVDGGCPGVQNVAEGIIGATSMQFPLLMASMGVEAVVEHEVAELLWGTAAAADPDRLAPHQPMVSAHKGGEVGPVFGPAGAKRPTAEVDIRVGGRVGLDQVDQDGLRVRDKPAQIVGGVNEAFQRRGKYGALSIRRELYPKTFGRNRHARLHLQRTGA